MSITDTTTQHHPLPGPPPRRRRTTRWVVVAIVAAVAVSTAVVAAVTFGVWAAMSLRQETTTETVPGVRELVVQTVDGSVSLRRGAGSDVEIRTTEVWSEDADSRPTLQRRRDGGVLTLTDSCPLINIGCEVDREIVVPDGTAVRVRTVDGSIDAAGLVAPSVDLSTVDGSVRVTVPAGDHHVETSTVDGGVRVDVPDNPAAASRISVRTVDGQIDIRRG
jgi:hypothetical protein